jgi:signal transduction histidine kinase
MRSLLSPFTDAADRLLSRLLRFDLTRTDVVKWVYFARQLMAVMLFAVVAIAGLSAYLSARQAADLLRNSARREALAIAGAAARRAFVPLTLDDDQALAALADSYRTVPRLAFLRVRGADGRVRARLEPPPGRDDEPLVVAVPVAAPLDAGPGRAAAPVGTVQVALRTRWIDARVRAIALSDLAVSGGLALLVLLIVTVAVRHLVERTRELVGEARLAAEIKRVNAELESFSYSVAHDLRAPLRAVDGFSKALLDKYGDRFDAEGRDWLARVRGGCARMGLLIDDLLTLSRVTRGRLREEDVDLGLAARMTMDQLRLSAPHRDADIAIEDGLIARGDPGLLRAAVENLLSNAWKYTSRHPRARIEFGAERRDGRRVFFVRDDGAGFDMAHAGKLFQPFSRLHSRGEFDGTGIGLATVQRIVERHGGRVWADGAVEKGATFYFTLGETP